MAKQPYALVRDGVLIEVRDVEPESIPVHKLDTDGGCLLRPFVVAEEPAHNPTLETATVQLVITPEKVEQVWTVARRSLAVQHEAVKTECGRRIYTLFPQWKQANLTARATELVNLRVVNGTLTEQEIAEFAVLQSIWDWIKAVRAASDALEAMDPIPLSYQSDQHWPAEWGA